MQAINVGIREAKINLSKLLKNVQKGMEITITHRGRPIAKIIPVAAFSLPLAERVKEMERQGWVEPLKKKPRELHPAFPLSREMDRESLEQDQDS